MNWSDLDTRSAYYCVAEVVRRRRRTGAPIPAPVRELFARLDHEIRSGVSTIEDHAAVDLIDSRAAAAVLGCTPRRVQQIAADLDGVRIGGRWLFSRHIVEEYADAIKQRPA